MKVKTPIAAKLIMAASKAAAVFAAALAFSLSAAAAQNVNGISASPETVSPGDKVTVTISVPPTESADTASVKVVFDPSVFEVFDWDADVPGGICGSTDDGFALMAANADRDIDLSEGLTLTALLSVKPGAKAGSTTISLTDASFSFFGDDAGYTELWTPEITEAEITIADAADTTAAETAPVETIAGSVTEKTSDTAASTADPPSAEQENDPRTVIIIAVTAAVTAAAAVLVIVIIKRGRK